MNWDIDSDCVEKLSSFLSEHDWEVTIMLQSEWWETFSWSAVLYLLDTNKDRITLVWYWEILSCAFDIFFRFRWKRIIASECIWMYHLATVSLSINSRMDSPTPKWKFFKEYIHSIHEESMLMWEMLQFTSEEMKMLNEWEDLYFWTERMKQFNNLTQQKDAIQKI